MGNKVFAKQLALLALSTAVLFLAACSEIVELPEVSETAQATEQVTEQNTEQQTSLAAPIIIGKSATDTTNSTEPQTPASQPATTLGTPTPAEPAPTPVTTVVEPAVTEPVTEPQITPEPVVTEPVVTEPVVTEPQVTPEPVSEPQAPLVTPEPVVAEPTEPVVSEPQTPVTPAPVVTEPVVTEPVITEPQTPAVITPEPIAQPVSEPIVTAPVVTTPVIPEPVVTTPVIPEPVVEPVVAAPVVTAPANTSNTSNVWQPTPGTTWQWQLSGDLDLSLDVAMYDLDLFDTEQSVIDQLHAEGRIVICYFSAGTLEPWRTDVKDIPAEVIGKKMVHWDEYWLDISSIDKLASVMTARLDLAVEKNCDGVEPDNIDSYQNQSGFPLTAEDQLNYNKFLAIEAHKRGLSIGLKNDVDQVEELEPYFDWALNESCFQYNECHKLSPFIENNKAVFGVEYTASTSEFCGLVNGLNFDFLKKDYSLSASTTPCR